jgi:large subunit ribosomal protein L29
MEMKELLAKDVIGLNNELTELLKAQFKLRMQKGTQQLQDTSQLGKTKKEIARVKTALTLKAAGK